MDKYSISSIIFSYIMENPKTFIIYCLLTVAMPISDVVLPHYYGKIIGNLKTKKNIKKYIYIVAALLILVQLLNTGNEFLEVYLYPRMVGFIRKYYLDAIFESNSTQLREIEIGRVLSQIIRFPSTVYNYIEDIKNTMIPFNVIYIFELIYLSYTDWTLGLLILCIIISINVTCYFSLFGCVKISEKRDHIYNNINEHIDDILRNIVSVLNNDQYDTEIDKLNDQQKEFIDCSIEGTLCTIKYKSIFTIIFVTIMGLFVWRCFYLYNSNKIDLPKFISIFIIVLYLFNTVLRHTNIFKNLMIRFGMIYESFAILRTYDNNNKIIVRDPININTCISLKNISFGYPGKPYILDDIDLDIMCGDNIVITGEIGSGKSSLIKLIMRYYIPQAGEIYLQGQPYSRLSEIQIRQKIGYISQAPILFNRNLLENIKYSKKDATDEDVYELIESLELNEHFKRYPNGLNTLAGKNGNNLSGGEKQIVWVLRVLLQNPDILILDEPTSAMDDNTRDALLSILMKVTKNKTVIAVTHDKDLLRFFNKKIIVRDKKIFKL